MSKFAECIHHISIFFLDISTKKRDHLLKYIKVHVPAGTSNDQKVGQQKQLTAELAFERKLPLSGEMKTALSFTAQNPGGGRNSAARQPRHSSEKVSRDGR